MFKKRITRRLEKYVKKYFERHPDVKLVTVAGSVGKTSTKIATATILNERYRVRLHRGNHNTHISAPLAILGIDYPGNPHNFWQWHKVFSAARKRIKSPAETEPEVIIQELGTDHPGDMAEFSRYLLPDIAIVTSVTPEHMEYFGSLSAVAREELSAVNFAKQAIINREDISGEFSNYITNSNIVTYGSTGTAEYTFEQTGFSFENGFEGVFSTPELGKVPANIHVIGEHSLRPVVAAVTIATKLGLTSDQIASGAAKIRPVPGRMNLLPGTMDSSIIDDTYNSSPAAAVAALEALYKLPGETKIAVLGEMNELGEISADEHRKLGELCDPIKLAWVITVGDNANTYLAKAARSRGCQVQACRNALEAGAFVHKVMEDKSTILFKGSQNKVFLEEAVKIILRSTADEDKLVRQDAQWLETKRQYFSSFENFADEDV